MLLIERYIFGRTLTLSLMALVSTTVMVLITQVLIYVNVLTASGQAVGTFFMLAATLVPTMVNIVLPFALFIGASQTLNTMNTDSELAVIESAGGSPRMTARPILILALAAALVSITLSMVVEPWSNSHKRRIIADASADLISVAVQSGAFQRIQSGLFLQVSEQRPSGEFAGVFIADWRDRQTHLTYYARRGWIKQIGDVDVLALEDGEVHRKSVRTDELSIVRFGSYVVDLAQFSAANAGGPSYEPSEQSTYYLLYGDRSDDYFQKKRPEEIRAELNRRFADWLYPIAFGMIVVFFGSRASSHRQERIWSVTAGAAIAISLRGAGFYFTNNSGTSAFYATLMFAAPIATILLFAGLLLTNKSLSVSSAIADRASALTARFATLKLPWLTVRAAAGARR
ncbi:MAG: LptF/LptG family permease [Rhizobiaceae bacterium]|nr:LptF/LptG family permease [Rhizobiaceae bacterium]